MEELETKKLEDVLRHSKSTQAFQAAMEKHKDNIYPDGAGIAYLNQYIEDRQLKKSDIIKKSNIAKGYGYELLNGEKKPSRDKLILLCLAVGMELEHLNRTLSRSQYSPLYAKNKRDAVLLFAIEKRLDCLETNALLFEFNEKCLE